MRIIIAHKHNPETPKGGVTIAAEIDDQDNVIAYAVAKCGPHDNFNRRTGRVKATGRLNSQNYRTELNEPINRKEFINNFYD